MSGNRDGDNLTQEQLVTLLTTTRGEAGNEKGFLSWRQETASNLEIVKKQRKELVERIARSGDPAERGDLRKELELLGKRQELLEGPLQALERIQASLAASFQSFCRGTHPQALAILHLAALSGRSPTQMRSDINLFAHVVLSGSLDATSRSLEERDNDFLDSFAAFRNNRHPYQKEISMLAEIYEIRLDGASAEERYAAFIGIAREEWRLELIRKGLAVKSAQEMVAEVRSTLQPRIRRAEAAAASERTRAMENQERVMELEHELEKLRRAHSVDELVAQKERERLDRRRREILAEIPRIRAEEQRNVQKGVAFRFHHQYGVLMAEAWARLQEDIDAGERLLLKKGEEEKSSAIEPSFLQIVAELIRGEDFEDRYLSDDSKKVIRGLNAFLAGDCPYENVVLQAGRDRRSVEQVERWLPYANFRGMQRNDFEQFRKGRHRFQKHLEIYIGRECSTPISIEEWADLWSRDPAPFVKGFDRMPASKVK